MKYFDTHAHYDWPEFDEDRNSLFKKLSNILIVNIGCNIESSIRTIEIIKNFSNFFGCIGIHPMYVELNEKITDIEKLITDKVVAIGETGIDYKFPNPSLQKYYFLEHIKLANKYNLPIIIHCRKAHEEVYNILKTNPVQKRGIMHCYSGNLEYAEKFLKLGFYFGFDGPITHSNKYDEIIKFLPIDKIVVETDAPLMPSFPFEKNDRSDSSQLKYIIEKISKIKSLDLEFVEDQLFKNAMTIYNIKKTD